MIRVGKRIKNCNNTFLFLAIGEEVVILRAKLFKIFLCRVAGFCKARLHLAVNCVDGAAADTVVSVVLQKVTVGKTDIAIHRVQPVQGVNGSGRHTEEFKQPLAVIVRPL